MLKNFGGSLIFSVVALALAGLLGWSEGGSSSAVLQMVFLAAVLGIMEVSLSLDNAVVNASILKDMDAKWQQRFLTWGILIAVFGMRIIFPLVIVSVSAWVSPWEATRIALFDHKLYEQIVTGAHVGISGFGGAFLMLVGATFFFDTDREHLWISKVEGPLTKMGQVPFSPYVFTAGVIVLIAAFMHSDEAMTFLIAGATGIATYFAVQKFGDLMGGETDASGKIVRTGLSAFIYLEFLDASFSFDGVIGAFAITNNIILIALGLGIGAMFVRSMTIALVRGGHLSEFRFLESGAFYAIIALATIMLISVLVETPEVVTGLIGAAFIGASYWASVRHKRLFPAEYAEDGDANVILPDGNVIPGATTTNA